MAVVFSDNFDSYTDGSVAGQGSWTGGTGYNVGTTVAQSGTKSVGALNNINGTSQVDATFTSISSGTPVFTFYVYNNTTAVQACYTYIRNGAGGAGWVVLMRANNTWLFGTQDFGTFLDNQSSWTASTWHKIDIEMDLANTKARFRVDGGTYSSYVTNASATAVSDITMLQGANSAGTSYWDTMTVDDGTVASTGHNLTLLGVGT